MKTPSNISALCREYGISRQTGHKWLRRFRDQGYTGLVEQSRRPLTSPLTTAEEVVVRILELRDHHPTWGPDKIARVLRRAHGEEAPSKSTVARVLQRLGRTRRQRPRVRIWSVDERPHVEVHGPNDLWTIDLKGWWRARNGERCEPLTVRDACSRKVLAATLLDDSHRLEQVRHVLRSLFERHGLPAAMQSDNGTPFVCTRARGGLSQLSAWLISLGIRLLRSRPGCPQDNGGHERMHRDLAELELRPARTRRSQQRECDRWMVDFNEVRPHDALGGKTPAEVYRNSERRSLEPLTPSYPPEWKTRRVSKTGTISLDDDEVFLSAALAGQVVGLKREGVLRWRAHFFDIDFGTIEIVPLAEVLTTDGVNTRVNPHRATGSRAVSTPVTAPEPLNERESYVFRTTLTRDAGREERGYVAEPPSSLPRGAGARPAHRCRALPGAHRDGTCARTGEHARAAAPLRPALPRRADRARGTGSASWSLRGRHR